VVRSLKPKRELPALLVAEAEKAKPQHLRPFVEIRAPPLRAFFPKR